MPDEIKDLDIPKFQVPSEPSATVLRDISFILNVPLELTVELGRGQVLIQELLQLVPGSVLALDKLAGEPMDVLVNDRLVGQGEVVVVNETFGIRLTDIVSASGR